MRIKKVLSRFYVYDIDKAVEFYEKIFDEKCSMKFDYPEMNLKLASVGNVLIISGCDEALKQFKDTKATFLVDSVAQFRTFLLNNGAEIIRDLKEVPSGRNMTVKHLDGTIVEYVEHSFSHYSI
ncbi:MULTISPECIES: VOC family protein [Clostridium]|uniref:VOC family protein n=1 Tax=Clostridium TaxID=1485 RepID=UPI0008257A91|nr:MULTISPECIES: glyoxalase/bleomycin resistance/dioxygenase family protein [Clostridium]PJI06829.1 glyoxalase/bleomycin resistance/dioxygenase family protein [Clostridium sp. CT7]